jgi:hypothetical protein
VLDRNVLELVMIDDFKKAILAAVSRGASLSEFTQILRQYRDLGLTKQLAHETLEGMRAGVDEQTEDRVLEVLDIVWGFCNARLRVWEEA